MGLATLEILEFVFVALLISFTVTQVIWPIVRGTALCPLFRRRSRELERELIQAGEDVQTKEYTQQIARRREEAARLDRSAEEIRRQAAKPPTYPDWP